MAKHHRLNTALGRFLLTAIVAAVAARVAAAQDVIPQADNILVVPGVAFEPAHPKTPASSPIMQAGFTQPGEETAQMPTPDLGPVVSRRPRFWVATDYLVWHVTPAPIAVPLVTTNTSPAIGALNEPGTQILVGAGSGQDNRFGAFSGGRLTIGGWLEQSYEHAWEGSGFGFGRGRFTFSADSAGGAAPVVSVPFNATQPFGINPAGETALNAGGAPSNANVQLTSQMWGLEINQLLYFSNSQRFYCAGLVGFRYLALNENLTLTHTSIDTSNSGTVAVTDGFGTRNQYYAGQVGMRFGWSLQRLTFETGATVAFGNNHEVQSIAGSTTVTNGAFGFTDGSTPGGVFAQPSNIGGFSRDWFSVVPEFYLKANFAITQTFSTYIGYSGLYMSNVIRPGNQIDRNVNPTQNAFFVPPGTITGTAAPVPIFQNSTLWAHGLQLGIELHF